MRCLSIGLLSNLVAVKGSPSRLSFSLMKMPAFWVVWVETRNTSAHSSLRRPCIGSQKGRARILCG